MRILHVSDIHYQDAPETWTLLKEARRQFELLRPDMILVTGDLTHDGLDEQFLPVKRFLGSLNFCPVLVVPGNRDQVRAMTPAPVDRSDLEYFLLTHPGSTTILDEIESPESLLPGRQGRYFEHFNHGEFFYRANGIAAVGLNSTPDISQRHLESAIGHFSKGPADEIRIFCAHHSFLPVPTKKLRTGDILPRSADILQALIEQNVNLLCCGHIHRSHVWDLSDGRHRLLCCNAGSLLDTSGKKDNGFLEIEFGRDQRITKHSLFTHKTDMLYHRLYSPGDVVPGLDESENDERKAKKAKGKR